MKSNRTIFSKSDLYHLADELTSMYTRLSIILKLARAEDNKEVINAYSGIVFELELLIESYGLKELVKID